MNVLASHSPSPASPAPMRQMPLDLGPVASQGLDDFVTGPHVALLAWLHAWPDVGASVSPAYIWGPSGAGKTHLLRAMVERALGLGLGVIWLNAQTCQMWDASEPLAPTLALIDECEQLDADQQHLAFNLFIESASPSAVGETGPLYILAAGTLPPVDLPVRDDLRTRLGWGQIFALSPLDEAGVREALQHEANRRGMDLGEGLVSYLLTRYDRNLGSLMALLDRLDRYALAEHRLITVPLLKQMLAVENP